MKYSFTILALLATALARPEANEATFDIRIHSRDVRAPQGAFVRPRWNAQLNRREVPQEHSHEKFVTSVRTSLNLNNPNGIVDPVFGLLGNGAAKQGLGKLTDTECLQQATADQAFTNAKAAGDITGMTNALVFRALERNTGQVGLASNSCTSIVPANPQIAALAQHQDPASANAAAVNKKITLDLAVQIASIGGDPTVALQSGTFAPGKIGDPTAAGNTCDVQTDPIGCIFTQNLLVEDATADEVTAAVAAAGKGGAAAPAPAPAPASAPAASTSTAPAAAPAAASTSVAAVQVISTMIQTVTVCPTPAAAAAPAGMTVITMSTADASAVMSVAASMGMAVHTGKTTSNAANTGAKAATQTTVQVQSATATVVAAVASTSVDCSGAIASALAAANLGGAAASVPAASTPTFSNVTTPAAAKAPASTTTAAAAAPATGKSSLNLGSCANPTIIFANNLDGRNQPSFAPADESTFTHGSALGIKVITDFICQQLGVKCKASAATITACNQGAAAAQGQTGQAAADAFNKALGF